MLRGNAQITETSSAFFALKPYSSRTEPLLYSTLLETRLSNNILRSNASPHLQMGLWSRENEHTTLENYTDLSRFCSSQ